MSSTSFADGEIYSKIFYPGHFHTIRNIGGAFKGGKYYHSGRSLPCCQKTVGWEVAGCDEIRTEMSKALNRERVYWLIHMCQLAKTSNDWQNLVINPIHKKKDRKECTNRQGISLLSFHVKVYAKWLV